MNTPPVVRLFIACSGPPPGKHLEEYRLEELTTIVHPRAGDDYPLALAELCFYALLTDGRGTNEFAIQQRYGVGPNSRTVWQSRTATVDLGQDPLALTGFPMRLKNIAFHQPGQYEFALLCNGSGIALYYVEAREVK